VLTEICACEPVAVKVYHTSGCEPPPWQPTEPVQLSLAPTVVPERQGPPGVMVVALVQRSLAGCAKITVADNKEQNNIYILFKARLVNN
jgi:hypothetical protein